MKLNQNQETIKAYRDKIKLDRQLLLPIYILITGSYKYSTCLLLLFVIVIHCSRKSLSCYIIIIIFIISFFSSLSSFSSCGFYCSSCLLLLLLFLLFLFLFLFLFFFLFLFLPFLLLSSLYFMALESLF